MIEIFLNTRREYLHRGLCKCCIYNTNTNEMPNHFTCTVNGAIYNVIVKVIFSHVKITCFHILKVSYFYVKAQLWFHQCSNILKCIIILITDDQHWCLLWSVLSLVLCWKGTSWQSHSEVCRCQYHCQLASIHHWQKYSSTGWRLYGIQQKEVKSALLTKWLTDGQAVRKTDSKSDRCRKSHADTFLLASYTDAVWAWTTILRQHRRLYFHQLPYRPPNLPLFQGKFLKSIF